MHEQAVLGWDLGGAHVKVARISSGGQVERTLKLPCPLWQGIGKLESAVSRAMEILHHGEVRHAVTMTGELVDLFSGRPEGVRRILRTLAGCLGRMPLQVYAGERGLISPAEALAEPEAVASANWHASAAWLAMHRADALLVDVGSTTADLVTISGGRVTSLGLSDHQRLTQGELVYTGATRTPVMALARRAPVAGHWVGVVAEHFATTADVHRLTGAIDERSDLFPAADNGPKTFEGSARRLARMVGMDLDSAPLSAWHALAAYFSSRQLQLLEAACRQQISRHPWVEEPILVGAGSGAFIARDLAQRLSMPYEPFPEAVGLRGPVDTTVLDCIPAMAVAYLSGAPDDPVARSA